MNFTFNNSKSQQPQGFDSSSIMLTMNTGNGGGVNNTSTTGSTTPTPTTPASSITASNLLCNQDPNQLTSPKNICAICSDKASGKHYGVHR